MKSPLSNSVSSRGIQQHELPYILTDAYFARRAEVNKILEKMPDRKPSWEFEFRREDNTND